MTEGLLIALFGGVIGFLLTYFGIQVMRAGLSFNDGISAVPVTLDTNVLLFASAGQGCGVGADNFPEHRRIVVGGDSPNIMSLKFKELGVLRKA